VLLLRFDATRDFGGLSHDGKPSFHSALLAYVAGLATTLYVMIAFKAAQLAFVVPGTCMFGVLLCLRHNERGNQGFVGLFGGRGGGNRAETKKTPRRNYKNIF
jgi:hypothetical protein